MNNLEPLTDKKTCKKISEFTELILSLANKLDLTSEMALNAAMYLIVEILISNQEPYKSAEIVTSAILKNLAKALKEDEANQLRKP